MLTPNATYKLNGVTVNEKIIPDGTLWKDNAKAKAAGFSGAGANYKRNQKLSGGTGKVQSVTIHNTGDLAGVYDDGEQYTRATYNENMGSARVHFYVDDTGAWQNLKAGTGLTPADPIGSAEVSWHSGDGSVSDGGNMTSLSMEIIMGENTANDAKAYDNGAKIAAWLLWKHNLPISKLLTHTYWVNKSAGKVFSDPDEQCTNLISGKKWCPSYIFGSTSHSTALGNWKTFKALVKKYLDALNAPTAAEPVTPSETLYYVQTGAYKVRANADAQLAEVKAAGFDAILKQSGDLYRVQVGAYSVKSNATAMEAKLKAAGFSTYITTVGGTVVASESTNISTAIKVGDKVKCKSGVTKYYNGATMPTWVRVATLYVRQIEQGGKVYLVSTEPTKKEYTGRVNASDVTKI